VETGQRLRERANLVVACAVLALQPIEHRSRVRAAPPQDAEEVPVLFGMVLAFREGIDVIDHRVENAKVRRSAAVCGLADEMKHAVQHCGERAMLVANGSNRFHRSVSNEDNPIRSIVARTHSRRLTWINRVVQAGGACTASSRCETLVKE
jgi:hypothetical protein